MHLFQADDSGSLITSLMTVSSWPTVVDGHYGQLDIVSVLYQAATARLANGRSVLNVLPKDFRNTGLSVGTFGKHLKMLFSAS